MVILVKIIGILLTAFSIISIAKPDILKKVWIFFSEGKRYYYVGVLRIVFGVFFLLAASKCDIPIIILILGLVSLAAGILAFFLKQEKVQSMIQSIIAKPVLIHRLIALIPLVMGLLIVYSA